MNLKYKKFKYNINNFFISKFIISNNNLIDIYLKKNIKFYFLYNYKLNNFTKFNFILEQHILFIFLDLFLFFGKKCTKKKIKTKKYFNLIYDFNLKSFLIFNLIFQNFFFILNKNLNNYYIKIWKFLIFKKFKFFKGSTLNFFFSTFIPTQDKFIENYNFSFKFIFKKSNFFLFNLNFLSFLNIPLVFKND